MTLAGKVGRNCLAWTVLVPMFVATMSQAENWKGVGIRASDGEPVMVDTEYMVDRDGRVEVRAKAKVQKAALTLFAPNGEEEERYLIDCDARKAATLYRKVTKDGNSNIERDFLPSAIALVDIPPGSKIQGVADWACPEFKRKLAAPSAPAGKGDGGTTGQQTKINIPDDAIGRYKWKLLGLSIAAKETDEIYDAYIGEDTTIEAEKGLYGFATRNDFYQRGSSAKTLTGIRIVFWVAGCSAKQLTAIESMTLDTRGQVVDRHPIDRNAGVIAARDGTIGATYLGYACKTASAQAATKR